MTDWKKLIACFEEIGVPHTSEIEEDTNNIIVEVTCKRCYQQPGYEFDKNGKFIEAYPGNDG